MAEHALPEEPVVGQATKAVRTSPTRVDLVWYAIARAAVELVCRTCWRVRIEGKSKIPRSGPFVIAPVHRSNIDTLLAGCLVRRRIRFMGKDSLWKYKWSAALFDSLGAFPVQRGTADRESLRICEEALRSGEPVVLFPEGTRQSGPVLQPLYEGAAFVAARADVPIVPVGIGGSEWAMPKGSRGIHFVKVVMVVGDPILPPPRSGGRVSRRAVTSVTEELSSSLQSLLDEAMKAAGRA